MLDANAHLELSPLFELTDTKNKNQLPFGCTHSQHFLVAACVVVTVTVPVPGTVTVTATATAKSKC